MRSYREAIWSNRTVLEYLRARHAVINASNAGAPLVLMSAPQPRPVVQPVDLDLPTAARLQLEAMHAERDCEEAASLIQRLDEQLEEAQRDCRGHREIAVRSSHKWATLQRQLADH